MTGLGLAPVELTRLLAALDHAESNASPPIPPGRVARYLRSHAGPVDECPQSRPQSPDLPRSQWTVAQVADRLGLTVRTVRRKCATGSFPGATRQREGRGRGWLIPAEALARHVTINEETP